MKCTIALGLLAAVALAAAPVAPQAEKSQVAKMTLKVGDVENRQAHRLPRQEERLSRRLRPGLHWRLNQATSGGPGWNRLR